MAVVGFAPLGLVVAEALWWPEFRLFRIPGSAHTIWFILLLGLALAWQRLKDGSFRGAAAWTIRGFVLVSFVLAAGGMVGLLWGVSTGDEFWR